jgi:3-deoxy-D-manno-octulosonic-acid transferase
MQRVRPDVIAVMETELWFNFLWSADVFTTPVFLINGRSSDRAFRRSMKFRWFFSAMLQYVTQCLVQTDADRKRFEALGAKSVEVYGNTKFDEAAGIQDVDANQWRKELNLAEGSKVVVIGSTRSEMEEKLVLEAFFALQDDNLLFIHAPRHLETAPRITALFASLKPSSSTATIGLRSEKPASCRYLVLDTYGELGAVYSIADVVVIGGGFDTLGGQNLIQPLALGKPVLHGANMFNFREASAAALEAGASQVCTDSTSLAQAIQALMTDDAKRKQMGIAAKSLVAANVGASKRYASAVATPLKSVG